MEKWYNNQWRIENTPVENSDKGTWHSSNETPISIASMSLTMISDGDKIVERSNDGEWKR